MMNFGERSSQSQSEAPMEPKPRAQARSGHRLPSLSRPSSSTKVADPAVLSIFATGMAQADALSQFAMLQSMSPPSPEAMLGGSSSFVSVSTPYVVTTTPTSAFDRDDEQEHKDDHELVGLGRGSHNSSSACLSATSRERLTFVDEHSVRRDSATELARAAKNDRRTTVGDLTFGNPRDSNLRESIRRVEAYSRREVPLEYELKSEVFYKKKVCELVLDREALAWRCGSKTRGTIPTDDIVAATSLDEQLGLFRVHYFSKGKGKKEKALRRKYRYVDFSCEPRLAERWILSIQELVRWQARAPPIAQKRKIKIILNPHSGKRRARKIWYEYVQRFFEWGNFDCYVEETSYGGHAIDMGKEFSADDGYEALVFVGGDGTLCEFMNGLLSRPEVEWREIVSTTPISLISAGTQNAFGTGVGIPTVEAAVYCILKRKMRPLDVVTAIAENDRKCVHYSYCGLAWGVGGDIAAESERYRWLGTSRYAFLKLKRSVFMPKRHTGRVRFVPQYPEPPLREYFDIQDETALDQFDMEENNVYDTDATPSHDWRKSWTGNGGALRSPASRKRFHDSMWETDHGNYMVVGACNTAPDAKYAHPSDGNIDLLVIRKGSLWRRAILGLLYLVGQETKSSLLMYRKVRAVIIETDQPDDCLNIDGEVLPGPGPWRMEIVPSLFKALSEK